MAAVGSRNDQAFVSLAILAALGVVGAEIDFGEHHAIGQVVLEIEAQCVNLVLDVRALAVACLWHAVDTAPAGLVTNGHGRGAGVGAWIAELERGRVAAGGKRQGVWRHDACVELDVALNALSRVVADIGGHAPSVVQFEVAFPAQRFDFIVVEHVLDVVDQAAAVTGQREGTSSCNSAADGSIGDRAAKACLDDVFLGSNVHLGIEQIELGVEVAVRTVGKNGCHAGALVGGVVGLLADAAAKARHLDALDHLAAGGRGLDGCIAPVTFFDRRRAAVNPDEAECDAKLAVHELVNVSQAGAAAAALDFKPDAVADFFVADGKHTLAEGQRVDQLLIDGTGQAGRHQRSVAGLVDGSAGDQFCRVGRQVDRTAVAGAGLFAAVEQVAVEVRTQAANRDVRCGAGLGALRGQAWQAGQRLGDGGVWQLADIFGGNRFNDRAGIALDVDGSFDTATDARHGHGLDLRISGRLGCLRGRRDGRCFLRIGARSKCGYKHGATCGDRVQVESKAKLASGRRGNFVHMSPHLISTTQFPEIQPGSFPSGSLSETF